MYASTVGGGAMTLVFRPPETDKKAVISAVKVPLRPAETGSEKTPHVRQH